MLGTATCSLSYKETRTRATACELYFCSLQSQLLFPTSTAMVLSSNEHVSDRWRSRRNSPWQHMLAISLLNYINHLMLAINIVLLDTPDLEQLPERQAGL
jgi:hypothetical protein